MSKPYDDELSTTMQKLYDEGMIQRRKVLGDTYVDNALAKGTSEFASEAQKLVTEVCWGALWTRSTFPHKYRSMINLAILSTIGGKEAELSGHVRGALRNGVTEQEIQEILLQVMIYVGMPAGLEAFRTADKAIQAYKAEQEKA